jgi:hypothetical protein
VTHAVARVGTASVGQLPKDQSMDLALTLQLRNPDQLQKLLGTLYNPASPEYHRYLSPEQFAERFGPTEASYAKVVAYARAHGLAVTHTYSNRLVVHVRGTVRDVERTFGVKMMVYQHPTEARTFYAPDREPSVDANLQVAGIDGLSNFVLPHPATTQSLSNAGAMASPATHKFTSGLSSGGSGFMGTFVASDLRNAYVPGVTLDGSGQAVGLLEFSTYRLSDIQNYFTNQKQTLTIPILNVSLDDLSPECGVWCDDLEPALDIEMAMALTPNLAAVVVYEGMNAVDIFNQMAADNLARQLSCSWVFLPNPDAYKPIFQEFAAQGQSLFASSGDGGAYSQPGCTGNCWDSLFPADDPYVTAVGGTMLSTNGAGGAWQSETSWVDSGGGVNDSGFAIPNYQTPLINASNQGSTSLRNIPDVSAVAFNLYVAADQTDGSAGGTSASAPLWASLMALVNQQANGSPVGFLNPSAYALALSGNYGADFHDITTGNNFNTYSPSLYSAVPGYDLVTGLGSPNGQSLIDALAPVKSSANFALSSSSSPLTVAQSAQATAQISLQALNGFTGTVQLTATVIGSTPGVTALLSQSSIALGTQATLTVSATDATASATAMIGILGTSGSLMQSLFLPVNIQLPNLVETAVSAPAATLTPGAAFSVSDTVENSGQSSAGASVTEYYLSDTANGNGVLYLLGSRSVPALSAGESSSGSSTATVPSHVWPNTPYYLLACPNATNSVAQATNSGCVSSLATGIYVPPLSASSTTLAVTASGVAATTVSAGTVVTLTATVASGTNALSTGQVNFCDATSASCNDIHRLGTAEVQSNGTATLRFIAGIGTHFYQAVFAGTASYASSSSSTASLRVTGVHATTATLTATGSAGDYTLTATVTGNGGAAAPSGTVSFVDTSNQNAVLGGSSLLAGMPALAWQNSQTLAAGNEADAIVFADFNGDGIPDMAVANRNDSSVSIYLGNGDGTFRAGQVITASLYTPQGLVAADFTGNGKIDLAVSDTEATAVTILLGNGDGTFTVAQNLLLTGAVPWAMAVGDFNHDGLPDLAVADDCGRAISIFLSNGDGTFTSLPAIPLAGAAEGVAVADYNGDGKLDLAVPIANGTDDSLVILLGNGDGTFTPTGQNLPLGYYPSAIVAADFNGDGKQDLAVTISEDDYVQVFFGNGDGTFTASNNNPPIGGYALSMALADFNGDGKPDIAVANDGDGTVTILLGNGDGTFATSTIPIGAPLGPISIAAADLTGKGYADFATANMLGNSASVEVSAWQQVATASLSNVSPVSSSDSIEAIYAGDSNFGGSTSAMVILTGVAPGNPAPAIATLAPAFTQAGNSAFTLSVIGTGFITTSVVYWNSTALTTQLMSSTQLNAKVPASLMANAGQASITVQSPAPGGGTSNVLQFELDTAGATAPVFSSPAATISAGQTAAYAVTTPAAATNITVTCLNLPSGATCSYSAANQQVSIATTSATPKGNYLVTVVFTQTISGAAASLLLPILTLPFLSRRRLTKRIRKGCSLCLLMLLLAFAVFEIGCSGAGGASSSGGSPTASQMQSSGVVTLVVQ